MAQRTGGEAPGVWIRQRGRGWQLRFRSERGGAFATETFASLHAAEARADECRALLAKRIRTTIDEAIDSYTAALRRRGLREGTLYVTPLRVRLFFAGHLEDRIDTVTPRLCAKLYDALVDATKKDGSLRYSVDTHRNALTYARSFGKWCVKTKLWRANPLDEVEGVGARSRRKPQLRFDEARAWYTAALARAPGDPTATGALVALLLGLRAGEIVTRTVRDLDDGGRLLWVEETRGGRWQPKTAAGRRAVEVPEPLRPLLLELAKGRGRDEALWPGVNRYAPRRWVHAVCRAAKVPLVSAHGMRGMAATLAMEAGTAGHVVAATLGHESVATTTAHYAAAGAGDKAQQRRALKVLQGGVTTKRRR